MADTPVRVLVVEDQPIMRQAISHIIRDDARFELVGEVAETGRVELAASRLRPDVVLLDLGLPGGDPTSLIPRLPTTLVYSARENSDAVSAALAAGAAGFVHKSVGANALCAAIEAVAGGAPRVLAGLEPTVRARSIPRAPEKDVVTDGQLGVLSARQQRIFRYLVGGATNNQIAAKESLSRRTVEGHRARIHKRLGCKNRADMVRMAAEAGVEPLLM